MNSRVKDEAKFSHIVRLPHGSFQLKFKNNGRDVQKVMPTLSTAIAARNYIYKEFNYRPNQLLVNFFDMDVVRDSFRTERSGNTFHNYQVHSRRLADRKYLPKLFSSKIEADAFARKWIKAYNSVAATYNGWREQKFLEQIELEFQELVPHVEVGFDVILWNRAAKSVFSDDIPLYFNE